MGGIAVGLMGRISDLVVPTWAPDYGDGSDGAINISSDTNWDWIESDNEINATSVTIDASKTLTLVGATPANPYIIRCQGACTINGAISGAGKGNVGGDGSSAPQGAGHGHNASGYQQSGAGAGHAATGGAPTPGEWGTPPLPGPAYDGLGSMLFSGPGGDWCAGSGGGRGGPNSGAAPGSGGAGGAGLLIVARNVVIGSAAAINCNGANGGNGSGNDCGGGGGGSGGLIVILANIITLPGSGTVITATGGAGGHSVNDAVSGVGGAGAIGRIYLCYLTALTGDPAARCDPDAVAISLRPTVIIG